MLGTPPSCIKVHTAHQQRRITKLSYRTRRASSKSHRLPQMSLVLQLISNGCSLRAAREIKRLTDALLVACTYDAARRRQTLDRGPMLLGPRTSVAGPWTSAAHRGRGLWHESRLQDVRLPKFLLPHSHVQSPKFVEHPAQLHRRRRPKFMFPHSLGCFGRQRRHALKKYWCPRSVSTPTNRMTL